MLAVPNSVLLIMAFNLRVEGGGFDYVARSHAERGNAYQCFGSPEYGLPRRAWEPENNLVFYLSFSKTPAATNSEDCGFCPVIKLPSVIA